MMRAWRGKPLVAVLVLAALVFCLVLPQAAGATTVMEVYEKLKSQPEYGRLVQELVDTGKVSEEEIDGFVADLSGRIPADVTRDNFEEEFYKAGVSAIADHPQVLDAIVAKYGTEFVQKRQLPPSLEGVKDAFLREMFPDGEAPGGGGGGGGQVPSGNVPPASPPQEQPQQPPAPEPGQPGSGVEVVSFADVQGHWAQRDIEFMAARGVVRGMGEGVFAPGAAVTRAEFATMLVRALGIADAQPTGKAFGDVPETAWYAGAVEAAFNRGLVGGMGDGTFAPNARITREQLAVMITNALRYLGKGVTLTQDQAAAVLGVYGDLPLISGWARLSLAEAVQAGIIKGRAPNSLAPQGKATRAEAVVMLRHMLEAAGAA